ncbi:hypothetical protein [Streptomyces sp. WZ-12]|uniref:hypothetical protein n=1 Tax=Streptomyces sp. WZ-12 TaxID=3030210 RepID=UPI002381539C|nr:hypothetical protein [Streptomyces sp. WZ-12]
MGTLMSAAAAFPTLFFTSALLVAVAFWLLVAVGLVDSGSFDADLDAVAWGVGGVPVAAACTVLAVLAWGVCLAGTVLLVPRVPPGASQMLVRLGVLVVAVLAAWPGTRLLLRPFRAPVPGRPGAEPAARTVTGSHRQ